MDEEGNLGKHYGDNVCMVTFQSRMIATLERELLLGLKTVVFLGILCGKRAQNVCRGLAS